MKVGNMTKRFAIALASTTAVIAAAVTVPLTATAQHPSRTHSAHRVARASAASAADAAFGVLRKDSAPADAAAIASRFPSAMNIDVSSVRSLTDSSGRRVWVMVGDDKVCLRVAEATGMASSGCAPTEVATDPQTPSGNVTLIAPGRMRLVMLLPDGASRVTVTPDGGASQSVTMLGGNVAMTTFAGTNGTFRWTDGSGVDHTMRLLDDNSH
jgi:hypothetical protein